jgi:hypothetical protein
VTLWPNGFYLGNHSGMAGADRRREYPQRVLVLHAGAEGASPTCRARFRPG